VGEKASTPLNLYDLSLLWLPIRSLSDLFFSFYNTIHKHTHARDSTIMENSRKPVAEQQKKTHEEEVVSKTSYINDLQIELH
jgi:hypothetical protein